MHFSHRCRPALREGLVFRCVDEDFFVYDPVSDQVVLLNASAAVVFDLCDGSRTPDQIASEIARTFGADQTAVTGEVWKTLDRLADSGLLTNSSGD